MTKDIHCNYLPGDRVYLAVNLYKLNKIVPLLCEITSISIHCNKKGKWTMKYRLNVVKDNKTIDYSYDVPFEDEAYFVDNYESIGYSPYVYYGEV